MSWANQTGVGTALPFLRNVVRLMYGLSWSALNAAKRVDMLQYPQTSWRDNENLKPPPPVPPNVGDCNPTMPEMSSDGGTRVGTVPCACPLVTWHIATCWVRTCGPRRTGASRCPYAGPCGAKRPDKARTGAKL